MIKITSFYPFAGFKKDTQEFYDDKIVVKIKSLTQEHEREYDYGQVALISDAFYSSGSQQQFAFIILIITSILFVFFYRSLGSISGVPQIIQGCYVLGLLILITGYSKHWHISLCDTDGNVFAIMKLTGQNRELVNEAINLVLTKSEKAQEITSAEPFPKIPANFEHTYYDFSRLEKTTDKFYADEIIGFQKNYLSERVYRVKYSSLNSKVYTGKIGIKVVEPVLSLTILISSILVGLQIGFKIISGTTFVHIMAPLFALSIITWPLIFVKRNAIGFLGKDAPVGYWAYVNKSDKEKIEKIIEFVQSRISSENSEATRKEQE